MQALPDARATCLLTQLEQLLNFAAALPRPRPVPYHAEWLGVWPDLREDTAVAALVDKAFGSCLNECCRDAFVQLLCRQADYLCPVHGGIQFSQEYRNRAGALFDKWTASQVCMPVCACPRASIVSHL